jgi:dUTP pyrophosphatase
MRKTFGIPLDVERIEYEMNVMGMNIAMLAEKCGYERAQLCKILRIGRCRPYTLENIAMTLELPTTEIMLNEAAYLNCVLDEGSIMPCRAHDTDAGLDLFSREEVVIPMFGCAKLDTGVHVAIPKNHVGLITSKSGLMQEGITSRGTIDAGYTGSIKAVLYNHNNRPYRIEKGQKITQLVILPIITPKPVLVDNLEATCRGSGGFGSSGKF